MTPFMQAWTSFSSRQQRTTNFSNLRDLISRMGERNRRYEKIEVTANFVFGNDLPLTHFDSLFSLLARRWAPSRHKGAFYLSPLMGGGMKEKERRKELLRKFNQLKIESHLPTFIYLIQRL